MRPRILAALCLAVAGCGGDRDTEREAERARAAAAAEREASERRAFEQSEAFEAAIAGTLDLVREGDLEEAKRAADEAGLLPGADRERVRALRESIEAEERRLLRIREDRELHHLLAAKVGEQDPAVRAERFEDVAKRIRTYLERYPDADGAGEIAAAAEFAENEAKKHRTYVASVAAARRALDEERWDDAIDASERAWKALPLEEARTLRQKGVRGAAPEGMVLVPGGPFPMGREKRQTVVEPFYIDRTEVTCRRYADFLAATGRPPPEGWSGAQPPKGHADHPVVRVTGADAAAFAKWAGKRLPTEVEWEKAARGPEGRIYPWGDDWDEEAGNFDNHGTRRVGESAGDFSWYGVRDMGGNVAEFTVPVLPFPERSLPEPTERRPRWAVKGGHWASGAVPVDNACYLRFPFPAGQCDTGTGFRCAKDAR